MAVWIYALCAITALTCAALLLVSARRAGSRMLFWSGLCFVGFALTNALVIVDALDAVMSGWNFGTMRLVSSLVAVSLLLYGLIFEEK